MVNQDHQELPINTNKWKILEKQTFFNINKINSGNIFKQNLYFKHYKIYKLVEMDGTEQ